MKEDAPILEDVAEVEEIEEDEQPLSDRDEVVNQIHKNREAQVKEEIRLSAEQAEEVADELEAEVEDVEETEEPEEEKFTLDVFGKKSEVPMSKVLEAGKRTLQKESAVDIKLRQIAQKEQEIQQREAKIDGILQEQASKEKLQSHSEFKKEFENALIDDEKKAAELLSARLAKYDDLEEQLANLQSGVEENKIFVESQKINEGQRLQNLFKSEFPKLAGDPTLKAAADRATVAIMRQNPEMGHDEVVLQAGKAVEEYYSDIFGGQSSEPGDNPRTVKQSMPSQVKKVAMKKQPPPEKKPKTRSEIVQDAIRARSPVHLSPQT